MWEAFNQDRPGDVLVEAAFVAEDDAGEFRAEAGGAVAGRARDV
jgi:hypothetical protein